MNGQTIDLAFLRRLIAPALWIATWAYLYLALLLTGWAVLVSTATGWDVSVISSSSMAPTIRPGDVILLDSHGDDLLGQRTVIQFDDPPGSGDHVVHRIVAVNLDGYVTQGDANVTPDSGSVEVADVTGVARLVIPFVGLPAYWLQSGDILAFAMWALLTVAAVVGALVTSRRGGMAAPRASSAEAHTAVRRVRILAAGIIAAQFFVGTSGFETADSPVSGLLVFIGCVVIVGSLNLASLRVSRTGDARSIARFALIELSVDTLLAVLLTSITGSGGVGWVLFALPIVEAAIRFRLAGALVQWVIMTTLVVVSRIWVLNATGRDDVALFAELKGALDQLSVLLLVAIPGAYLAEQLLSDVVRQRSATTEATERNRLFHEVVEIGQEVGRLGAEVYSTVSQSILRLGFDAADVCVRGESGVWRSIASASSHPALVLPAPGELASGLRPTDCQHQSVIVDLEDPQEDERTRLAQLGLSALVRLDANTANEADVVIRAAVVADTALSAASMSALKLLVNQTSVALQNDTLLAELRSAHSQLELKATHDGLTGLPNRVHFHDQLQIALAAPGRGVGLLFCDLNGFKPVNDRLGHDVGDELLIAVGGRFQASITNRGLVARLGGDEFTVLIPDCASEDEAIGLAAKLSSTIREPFELPGGHTVSISTSIGIAVTAGPVESDELLRRGDLAMYHAKSARTGDWALYSSNLDLDGDRQRQLETELADAIGIGQIQLHYQPIVDGRTRRMAGAEALLRWHHPEQGWIAAHEIIALAEKAGVSEALTRYIVQSAVSRLRKWHNDHPEEQLFMSVNLSPSELESPQVVDIIEYAMADTANRGQLWIEISEKLVADGAGRYQENLDRLDALGIQLVLDDFGEGHTALGYMRDLPIRGLKIDRNLVVNAVATSSDAIIFDSVVELAHRLGLFVVAEGVEEQIHVDRCRLAGCDLLQGYVISKPVAGEYADAFLARHLSTADERTAEIWESGAV